MGFYGILMTGGGVRVILGGLKFWPKVTFFGSMKYAGNFFGSQKNRGIFWGSGKRTKGFFWGMLKIWVDKF